jgi:transcriptional regulator with XRE-family HTH domain
MTLGNNIKSFRVGMHITQDELAEKIGVSRSSIANWETDRTEPGVDEIKRLTRLFEIGMDRLVGNGDIKKEEPKTEYFTATKKHIEAGFKITQLSESELDDLDKYINFLISQRSK